MTTLPQTETAVEHVRNALMIIAASTCDLPGVRDRLAKAIREMERGNILPSDNRRRIGYIEEVAPVSEYQRVRYGIRPGDVEMLRGIARVRDGKFGDRVILEYRMHVNLPDRWYGRKPDGDE